MEIQATLITNQICIGSTFFISGRQPQLADVIAFANRVTGFVTVLQESRMVIDIKTAVLDCRPAISSSTSTGGTTWEVHGLIPESVG